ncbi:MAG: hypothetical protein J0H73_01315 [Salana multivorans]|uniref:DUF6571 family protein n=1 Tax=Salana multivorans TaxID=120377 RepID=UPI00095DC217|nr:DUF6571 family protein [Salana multivorans]MBN8880941.1 hypothetical protein [Salana multivorans]OJX93832.1 MAG: hypothetical protein BGO96_10105 [Micrococcales bacterium 73-15]
MATLEDVRSWEPGTLSSAADTLVAARTKLVHGSDDLVDGRPPASWTTADAAPAATEIASIESSLATQVAEISTVVSALDAASSSIATAKNDIEAALGQASANGITVDLSTGAVTSTRTFTQEQEAERQDLQRIIDDVAAQLTSALEAATTADADLSAVLTSAAATDDAAGPSLEAIDAFLDLPPGKKVDYLLDHPELAEGLLPYASDDVKDEVGRELGERFDAIGRDPRQTMLQDPETLARYTAYLEGFGGDGTVMAALYTRLGPDGLTAALGTIGDSMLNSAYSEEQADLAVRLRDGLGVASTSDGFDGERFGRDLVRYAAPSGRSPLSEDELRLFDDAYPYAGSDPSVLDFLMRDGDCSGQLVRGVADELDAFERADPMSAQTWYSHGASPLGTIGLGPDEWARPTDPMAAVMGQLGRHPEEALRFFDPPSPYCTADVDVDAQSRAQYYFAERDWRSDGYEGVSQAVHAIGTDPDLRAAEPGRTAMTVSRFFDEITDNDHFTADDAKSASPIIGDLMKHYMPSLQSSINAPDSGPDTIDFDRDQYLPELLDQPQLDDAAGRSLLAVAMASDEGMARVAEGFAGYRQMLFNSFAGAGLDVRADGEVLRNYMESAATLEGHVQKIAGDAAIDRGREVDAQIATFTDLVSDAAGWIPVPGADVVGDVVGTVGKNAYTWMVSEGRSWSVSEINGLVADNESTARALANEEARVGQDKVFVSTYLALAEAGIVDLPADWRVGADGAPVQVSDITVQQLQQHRADVTGGGVAFLNEQNLLDAYGRSFETYWADR